MSFSYDTPVDITSLLTKLNTPNMQTQCTNPNANRKPQTRQPFPITCDTRWVSMTAAYRWADHRPSRLAWFKNWQPLGA